MFNCIPVIGWAIAAIAVFGYSVPFWFFWTYLGVGAIYFSFLPVEFHTIPFWHSYALFYLGTLLRPLLSVPIAISHSQTATPSDGRSKDRSKKR